MGSGNIENDGGLSGSGDWTPQGVTTAAVGGISAGTNLGVVPVSVESTLLSALYPYTVPGITLAADGIFPQPGPYEYGDAQLTADFKFNATTVKKSLPMTTILWEANVNSGGWVPPVPAVPVVNPNGGVETITASPPPGFVSNNGGTTNLFRATVTDGSVNVPNYAVSNTLTYRALYPFYYGVGAQALNEVGIVALTKLIQVQGNKVLAFAPVNQVYYFAYPAAYPNLSSITDINGFPFNIDQADPLKDWVIHNPVVLVGLDGSNQNYKVYEYMHLTGDAGNLTFNF